MQRIKCLNRYQKGVLLVMAVMVLVFAVVYSMTISRVGFEYKDTILVPGQEKDSMVYSGKIKGQQAQFTVSEDKTVVFQHGDKIYGPYTAQEDPTAIPESEERAEHMTGVELRQGEEVLFRGGVLDNDTFLLLYNEDGTTANIGISFVTGNGIEMDENGNVIDSMEPSVSTILELMGTPNLIHKGEWFVWFGAAAICVFNAICILFADEMFRWNLAFQIRNADHAEPSDWTIAGRYIGWTCMTIMALVIFMIGIQ